MHSLRDELVVKRLVWIPDLSIGYYPVEASPYDAGYWENYRRMDRTPMGAALTQARRQFVNRYWGGLVVDIGIGGGRFVEDREGTAGYDINPHAVDWLKDCGRWMDPYAGPVSAVTFWDSLEHIHDFRPLLDNVTDWVFCSLPIFTGVEDVLQSKHYKPHEHCWYFTMEGIIGIMDLCGFDFRACSNEETRLGRESVITFAFQRRRA